MTSPFTHYSPSVSSFQTYPTALYEFAFYVIMLVYALVASEFLWVELGRFL